MPSKEPALSWPDFILERTISEQELSVAIAGVFGINPDAVSITRVLSVQEVERNVQVWGTVSSLPGSFSTAVALYPQSDSIRSQITGRKLVEELCVALRCRSLMTDDTLNPYRMLVIEGPGAAWPVLLNAAKLDAEEPEYVIERTDSM
jgi:hypothetical protein